MYLKFCMYTDWINHSDKMLNIEKCWFIPISFIFGDWMSSSMTMMKRTCEYSILSVEICFDNLVIHVVGICCVVRLVGCLFSMFLLKVLFSEIIVTLCCFCIFVFVALIFFYIFLMRCRGLARWRVSRVLPYGIFVLF